MATRRLFSSPAIGPSPPVASGWSDSRRSRRSGLLLDMPIWAARCHLRPRCLLRRVPTPGVGAVVGTATEPACTRGERVAWYYIDRAAELTVVRPLWVAGW